MSGSSVFIENNLCKISFMDKYNDTRNVWWGISSLQHNDDIVSLKLSGKGGHRVHLIINRLCYKELCRRKRALFAFQMNRGTARTQSQWSRGAGGWICDEQPAFDVPHRSNENTVARLSLRETSGLHLVSTKTRYNDACNL